MPKKEMTLEELKQYLSELEKKEKSLEAEKKKLQAEYDNLAKKYEQLSNEYALLKEAFDSKEAELNDCIENAPKEKKVLSHYEKERKKVNYRKSRRF